MLIAEDITESIIGAAIEVHRRLGPGLLESAYEACLCHELQLRNVSYRRQVPLTVTYKGLTLDCAYRIDLVVEETVVVELKSVEKLQRIHEAQLITYLGLSNLRVGLLLNFNSIVMKEGILRRVV